MKNAFHIVRKDLLLRVLSELAPPIARLAHLAYSSPPIARSTHLAYSSPPIARLAHFAYSSPSIVLASGHQICSATGIQQGDLLGPVLLAMAVDEVASSLSSEINIWYLDDVTLGGKAEAVFADVHKCVTDLKKVGLVVYPSECDVTNMSYPVDEFTELVPELASDLPGLKRTEPADMELHGSAILDVTVKKAIANKLLTYHFMTQRQQQLDTHTGFFLLKNAFSLPRLLFLLRSSPCYHHSDGLATYDECTRSTAESICNVQFDDTSWMQT